VSVCSITWNLWAAILKENLAKCSKQSSVHMCLQYCLKSLGHYFTGNSHKMLKTKFFNWVSRTFKDSHSRSVSVTYFPSAIHIWGYFEKINQAFCQHSSWKSSATTNVWYNRKWRRWCAMAYFIDILYYVMCLDCVDILAHQRSLFMVMGENKRHFFLCLKIR
jgi:hypothetical protein